MIHYLLGKVDKVPFCVETIGWLKRALTPQWLFPWNAQKIYVPQKLNKKVDFRFRCWTTFATLMELIVKTSMLSFHSQSNVERFSSDLWNLSSSWRNWYCLSRASIVGCRNCPFHQPVGKDSSHGTLQSICRNWTSTSHNFHSPEYSGKRNRDIFDSLEKSCFSSEFWS